MSLGWTDADQAELDLLALELTDLWMSPAPREAKIACTEDVIWWIRKRRLKSKANYLRSLENGKGGPLKTASPAAIVPTAT